MNDLEQHFTANTGRLIDQKKPAAKIPRIEIRVDDSGHREPGTFIHAWHSRQTDVVRASDFTRSVHSLHLYNSILVIEMRIPPCRWMSY